MGSVALIGEPRSTERSAGLYRAAAREVDADLDVHRVEANAGNLARVLDALRTLGFLGAEVEGELAGAALAGVDQATPEARAAGAVDCVKVGLRGVLHGHVTAGAAVVAVLGDTGVVGHRVLLIGAGAVARSIAVEIARSGAADLIIADSNLPAAQSAATAARKFSTCPTRAVPGTDSGLADACRSVDLVINAAGERLTMPFGALAPYHMVLDVTPTTGVTPLIREAFRQGAGRITPASYLAQRGRLNVQTWGGPDVPLAAFRTAAATYDEAE